MDYEYDEEAAGHADDFANRIDENGPYVGQFTKAEAVVSREKGTNGIRFVFSMPGGGEADFTLWTAKADGERIFGFNKVQAMMTILGVRSLKAVPGLVQGWDDGKKVEVEGEVYPDLCNKDIGVFLSKELTTTGSGKESYRMNLEGCFRASDKLTASEIREKKKTPEKFGKIIKGLKTKDSRVQKRAEPGSPDMGAPVGDY